MLSHMQKVTINPNIKPIMLQYEVGVDMYAEAWTHAHSKRKIAFVYLSIKLFSYLWHAYSNGWC